VTSRINNYALWAVFPPASLLYSCPSLSPFSPYFLSSHLCFYSPCFFLSLFSLSWYWTLSIHPCSPLFHCFLSSLFSHLLLLVFRWINFFPLFLFPLFILFIILRVFLDIASLTPHGNFPPTPCLFSPLPLPFAVSLSIFSAYFFRLNCVSSPPGPKGFSTP